MNPLLLFALFCPDTVYFNEQFYIRLEQSEPAPPGVERPNAWQARKADMRILSDGFISKGQDSALIQLPGPVTLLFPNGTPLDIQAGTYDYAKGRFTDAPLAACKTVIKERATTRLQGQARPRAPHGAYGAYRLDGRIFP